MPIAIRDILQNVQGVVKGVTSDLNILCTLGIDIGGECINSTPTASQHLVAPTSPSNRPPSTPFDSPASSDLKPDRPTTGVAESTPTATFDGFTISRVPDLSPEQVSAASSVDTVTPLQTIMFSTTFGGQRIFTTAIVSGPVAQNAVSSLLEANTAVFTATNSLGETQTFSGTEASGSRASSLSALLAGSLGITATPITTTDIQGHMTTMYVNPIPTSPLGSSSTGSTSSSAAPGSNSNVPSSMDGGPDPSTEDRRGIVIGVVIGHLAIGTLLVLGFWYRRRKRNEKKTAAALYERRPSPVFSGFPVIFHPPTQFDEEPNRDRRFTTPSPSESDISDVDPQSQTVLTLARALQRGARGRRHPSWSSASYLYTDQLEARLPPAIPPSPSPPPTLLIDYDPRSSLSGSIRRVIDRISSAPVGDTGKNSGGSGRLRRQNSEATLQPRLSTSTLQRSPSDVFRSYQNEMEAVTEQPTVATENLTTPFPTIPYRSPLRPPTNLYSYHEDIEETLPEDSQDHSILSSRHRTSTGSTSFETAASRFASASRSGRSSSSLSLNDNRLHIGQRLSVTEDDDPFGDYRGGTNSIRRWDSNFSSSDYSSPDSEGESAEESSVDLNPRQRYVEDS